MSDPQQVEKDIREYLEKEPNLRREDRLHYLRAIFDKHLTFNKLDHLITISDLKHIISNSKNSFTNANLPMCISKKTVDNSELTSVALIEALTNYLNKNHLLKKLVKLDYTDSSGEFDEID